MIRESTQLQDDTRAHAKSCKCKCVQTIPGKLIENNSYLEVACRRLAERLARRDALLSTNVADTLDYRSLLNWVEIYPHRENDDKVQHL